jgi:hypothetical protein
MLVTVVDWNKSSASQRNWLHGLLAIDTLPVFLSMPSDLCCWYLKCNGCHKLLHRTFAFLVFRLVNCDVVPGFQLCSAYFVMRSNKHGDWRVSTLPCSFHPKPCTHCLVRFISKPCGLRGIGVDWGRFWLVVDLFSLNPHKFETKGTLCMVCRSRAYKKPYLWSSSTVWI